MAYIPDLRGVSWYHGRVERAAAESLLAGKRPGLYLVRDSGTCPGDYVLSVSENNKVSHYIISRRQNCYLIGDQSFQDLHSVIDFYKNHFLDTTTLTECIPPATRQQPLQPVSPHHAAPVTALPPPVNVIGKLIVVGKYDFNSDDPEDLCFKKGEKMTVIRKDEDEWWFARHENGSTGSIPVPYVTVIQDTTNDPLVAKAIMDRVRSTDDTALAFKAGDIIKVTKRNDNGIWEGEGPDGKKGHFPFRLVEVMKSN